MQNNSINICCVSSVAEALNRFMEQEYCLVIVDYQLSKKDGLEMLRVIRTVKHSPILVLTDPLGTDEKVALFQAGANASMEKPINLNVCAAQAYALIELYMASEPETSECYPLVFGTELMINPLYRQVMIDGNPLTLTRTEFDLLFCLAQHPGRIWSLNQLYNRVWVDNLGNDGDNTVRTHLGNLRKKLAQAGKEYVQNSRGAGYCFIPPCTTS